MTKDVVKEFLIFTGKHLRNIKMQIFSWPFALLVKIDTAEAADIFQNRCSQTFRNIHRKTLL